MDDRRLILYCEIGWDFLEQRHHHLTYFLLEAGLQVTFVERVVSRFPSLSELFARWMRRRVVPGESRRRIPKNLVVRRSPFLPPTNILLRAINWLIWFFLERPRQKSAIVYSFLNNPELIGGSLPLFSRYRWTCFDIIHNWWNFPWAERKHCKLADQCLINFDYLITDSASIRELLVSQGVSCTLVLPGVDEKWMDRGSLSSVPRPVFFGHLRANSDLRLVEAINKRFGLDLYGEISAALAGPFIYGTYKGSVRSDELVQLMDNYNVIVLPYEDDAFSQTISPAKYFESLATGSIVVTRSSMEYLPGFDDFVLKIDSEMANLSGQIKLLLESSRRNLKRGQQIDFCRKHSWRERFSQIEAELGLL